VKQKKRNKKKQTDSLFKKIKDRWILIVFAWIILYFPLLAIRNKIKKSLLDDNSIKAKAVIVDEENYFGNSPVSHDFSYSFEYIVEGEKYRKDSNDRELKIGDSISIEYLPIYPRFVRIIKDEK